MILYVLRHAIAVDKSKWRKEDSLRPLTPDGAHKMHKVAKGMKHIGVDMDWILTSPYRRASDTADIVADRFKMRKKVKVIPELASDGDPKGLVRHLAAAYRSHDTLLLVGHEPYLSRLVSVLIGSPQSLSLDWKKAGLCRLTAKALHYGRCATLEWWLPPKVLKHV
jgi:phosphohistidine phosphatase